VSPARGRKEETIMEEDRGREREGVANELKGRNERRTKG